MINTTGSVAARQVDSLQSEPPGKPFHHIHVTVVFGDAAFSRCVWPSGKMGRLAPSPLHNATLQNLDEHWGACMFLNYGFLWVYAK